MKRHYDYYDYCLFSNIFLFYSCYFFLFCCCCCYCSLYLPLCKSHFACCTFARYQLYVGENICCEQMHLPTWWQTMREARGHCDDCEHGETQQKIFIHFIIFYILYIVRFHQHFTPNHLEQYKNLAGCCCFFYFLLWK